MAQFPAWNWNGHENFVDDKADQIALGSGGSGRERTIDLIYVSTNGELHHKQQVTTAGSTDWVNLPPLSGPSQGKIAKAKRLALCGNSQQVLELFYIGTNDDLYRNRQVLAGGADWGLQTPFEGQSAKRIAVALDSLGRLDLFFIGTNSKLFHTRQKVAGGSDWEVPFHFNGITANEVAIALNANGFLEVFYTTTADDLYHFVQTSTADLGDFVNRGQFAKNKAHEIAVGQNDDGRLEIFYVGTNSGLYHNWQTTTADLSTWSGQARFPGGSAKHVSAVRNSDGRLELFWVGTGDELFHTWQVRPNGTWIGQVQFWGEKATQIAALRNAVGQIQICYIGSSNVICFNWQQVPGSNWQNNSGVGNPVPAPIPALGSSSNYSMSNCSLLTDVQVVVQFTSDLVCEKAGKPATNTSPPKLHNSNHGFTWQLNCLSTQGSTTTWQQYGFEIYPDGHHCSGFVENWVGPDIDHGIINKDFHLTDLPGRIPAGWTAQIDLINDQDNANILGISWLVADENGDPKGQTSCMLLDHGVKPFELAQVVCIEFVLVGEYNGQVSVFSSGAGDIRYASSTSMVALSDPPNCGEVTTGTAELSNAVYAPVLSDASNFLFQNFNIGLEISPLSVQRRERPVHARPSRASSGES